MTPPPDPPPPVAVPVRIRHIDSLRAVAAGLVVWLHYAQIIAPKAGPLPVFLGFLWTIPRHVEVGRLGVQIFFAISGFVICRSFGGPRAGGARRFLIKRVCRLYPAYWASLIAAGLAFLAVGMPRGGQVLAANVTMLAGTLGQPYLLGVYWTLEIELLFYGLCLALYLTRCLERRVLLAGLVLVLAWLPRVLKIVGHHAGIPLALPDGARVVTLSLAVMFWGALFRMAYDATGGFRRGVLRHGGTWLVAGLLWELIDAPDPNLKWYVLGLLPGRVPVHITVAAALLIFTVWVAVLRVDNRVLTYFGVISYSVYLFHLVPLIIIEPLLAFGGRTWERLPFQVEFLLCTVVSVAVSAAVYRWVEQPAIALGKRWARSGRPLESGPGAD